MTGCLVTRPEPGTADTAARVAALGWDAVLAPALVLREQPFAPPAAQAVLLPSRAAARALAGRLAGRAVLAVGEGTAAEARRSGAARAEAAAGDAESLAALAAARFDPAAGPLLLACGRGYGAALAAALRNRGFRVLRRVAYDAVPARALPGAALEALAAGRVRAALFLSPRSATVTIDLLRAAGLERVATSVRAVALSRRVATALAVLPWRELDAAERPDPESLLALLGSPPNG